MANENVAVVADGLGGTVVHIFPAVGCVRCLGSS